MRVVGQVAGEVAGLVVGFRSWGTILLGLGFLSDGIKRRAHKAETGPLCFSSFEQDVVSQPMEVATHAIGPLTFLTA